jgi:hypothetical protein
MIAIGSGTVRSEAATLANGERRDAARGGAADAIRSAG